MAQSTDTGENVSYSPLQQRLEEYTGSGIMAMHMPGHKRRLTPVPGLPYQWDITEVYGMDDLHHAEGILQEAMDRTARLVGSRRTWYLVNGSTCGNLAAIYASVPRGGEIIVARNCHKSVYHAAEILGLSVHFLEPERIDAFDIWGAVRAEDVERLLEHYPASAAVVVTSPTYEGVVSDIKAIAEAVHRAGRVLIVDEAHGAHLGLESSKLLQESRSPKTGGRPFFPDSAVHLGADVVIQSAHKTLPSLTQTALLHCCSERVSEQALEHGLDIFESSSPSYLLMASLDGCTGLLIDQGESLYAAWEEEIQRTLSTAENWTQLQILELQEKEIPLLDRSKLVIRDAGNRRTGEELGAFLRDRGRIEPEMCCGKNVLLMTSMADGHEDWERLRKALGRLNDELSSQVNTDGCGVHAVPGGAPCSLWAESCAKAAEREAFCAKEAGESSVAREKETGQGSLAAADLQVVMDPDRVRDAVRINGTDTILLREAKGRISAEYVMAYPPGIPILIPGAVVTEEVLGSLRSLLFAGTRLRFSVTGNNESRKQTEESVRLTVLRETC